MDLLHFLLQFLGTSHLVWRSSSFCSIVYFRNIFCFVVYEEKQTE